MQGMLGTLRLFSDTLSLPDNVYPKSVSQAPLDHKCLMCEQVSDTVDPVLDDLEDSMGQALVDARQEVRDQLTGDNAADLAKDMEKQVKPLRKNADLIRN